MSEHRMLLLLGVLAVLSLSYGMWGAVADVEFQGGPPWDLDYHRTAAARWHAVFVAFLLGSDSRASRRSALVCALAQFAGLLKEGLAVLPLLALAALWLSPSALLADLIRV